jgi:hypothetical protein
MKKKSSQLEGKKGQKKLSSGASRLVEVVPRTTLLPLPFGGGSGLTPPHLAGHQSLHPHGQNLELASPKYFSSPPAPLPVMLKRMP